MKRIEFSDNAYEIMEKTGVGEDVVEQIIMHHERDIGENQDSDPAEEGIKVAEESRGGFRVRVVYSTKPQEFGAGYGDAVVLSTNVLPGSRPATGDGSLAAAQ